MAQAKNVWEASYHSEPCDRRSLAASKCRQLLLEHREGCASACCRARAGAIYRWAINGSPTRHYPRQPEILSKPLCSRYRRRCEAFSQYERQGNAFLREKMRAGSLQRPLDAVAAIARNAEGAKPQAARGLSSSGSAGFCSKRGQKGLAVQLGVHFAAGAVSKGARTLN